ncbi:MAG: hypothetical protein IT168_13120 [Bryobacterales bacterium]|nr:hypothetical protein [Bryobacterales bacterium]
MVNFYEQTSTRRPGILFTGPLVPPPSPDTPAQPLPAPIVQPLAVPLPDQVAHPAIPTRIAVDSVVLNRTQGPVKRVGKKKVFSLAEAELVLSDWATDAPQSGFDYHAVDFMVRFSDGTAHGGLYRLRHTRRVPLAQYIRELYRFCSGTLQPEEMPLHLTPKSYEVLLRRYSLSQRLACLEFLEQYDL